MTTNIKKCSFCNQPHDAVETLVVNGNESAYICNNCVDMCAKMMGFNLNQIHILKHPGSIFISYSRKNSDKVRELESDIRRMGFKPWSDMELRNKGSQKWWDIILEQIRGCRAFVYVLSPDSLESSACRAEYKYASQLNRIILPIKVENVDMAKVPLDLAALQWTNYTQASKGEFVDLIESLQQIQNVPPLPNPLPEPPPTPYNPIATLRHRILTSMPSEHREIFREIEDLYESSKDGDGKIIELLAHFLDVEGVESRLRGDIQNLKIWIEIG